MYGKDRKDFLSLKEIMWKHKLFITAFILLLSICTSVFVFFLDNKYVSYVVIKPTESKASTMLSESILSEFIDIKESAEVSIFDDIKVMLDNKRLVVSFLINNHLIEKLADISEIKDSKDENDVYGLFIKSLSLKQDLARYIHITFQHKNPEVAQEILHLFLNFVSDTLKLREINYIDRRVEGHRYEMDNLDDIMLKAELSKLIVSLFQSKSLIQSEEYYRFSFVTEPSFADPADYAAPSRLLVFWAIMSASFILVVFGTVLYELIKDSYKFRAREG